jgi:hypothetical protein
MSEEGHMCSTCCVLGVVGVYRENQFLVATDVVSIPCGRLGGEEKIILKWLKGRMNSEFIRVS